jgi:AcrR family transcriptional regulator
MPPTRATEPQSPRRPGRRGRRLDPTRDAAILQAALEGLIEDGYDRLTMDQIAARAHAGKGALYRRWPSKAALVVDAIVAWRLGRSPSDIPDTGSLWGDLDASLREMPDFDHSDAMFGVLLGMVTAASRDPELAAALQTNVLEMPRRAINDAVRRGEIPPHRDPSLVADMIIGLNLLRVISGQPIDRPLMQRMFDYLVLPLGPVGAPMPSSRWSPAHQARRPAVRTTPTSPNSARPG